MQGAGKIAQFLFGSEKQARKIYYLEEKGQIPTFRMGSTICARKSAILAWIEEREGRRPAQ
ncbi:DNA-binding protein [Methylobacterium tardum]|uniref:DNA-binding protein n=1 Tax=Methylobacterium tardum TaxID=374432 RepID=UPI00361E492B